MPGQVSTEYSSTVISTGEERNSSFDFMKPSWDIVSQAEGRVEHRSAGTHRAISGANIEPLPKISQSRIRQL